LLILVPTAYEMGILWGDKTLEGVLQNGILPATIAQTETRLALCGFGLAASGAGAAWAMGRYLREYTGPIRHVILIGIAGTYDSITHAPGSAMLATGAQCQGISAGDKRWQQTPPRQGLSPVYDEVTFHLPVVKKPEIETGLLLSVAAASASVTEAGERAAQFPGAVAEDMEAFAVGIAAHHYELPMSVIRGISNIAGDRDKTRWQVEESLTAARELLESAILSVSKEQAQ
jgi:futalosine hydrolase